jgi:hypothetical protein
MSEGRATLADPKKIIFDYGVTLFQKDNLLVRIICIIIVNEYEKFCHSERGVVVLQLQLEK